MNQEKLIQNLIDQIVEAQLKLGYAKESMRFYYPVESLNLLLDTEYTDAASMTEALSAAFSEPGRLGKLSFHTHAGRVEVGVPPEGAEYVHKQVKAPEFLKDMIELFQTNHHCELQQIREVFEREGAAYVCRSMPEDADFDYVMYFEDPNVDPYYYCIKMEMGHTIYHRFTKEDFERI